MTLPKVGGLAWGPHPGLRRRVSSAVHGGAPGGTPRPDGAGRPILRSPSPAADVILPQKTTPALDTSTWPLLLKNYDKLHVRTGHYTPIPSGHTPLKRPLQVGHAGYGEHGVFMLRFAGPGVEKRERRGPLRGQAPWSRAGLARRSGAMETPAGGLEGRNCRPSSVAFVGADRESQAEHGRCCPPMRRLPHPLPLFGVA